jgi:hypothetical protein
MDMTWRKSSYSTGNGGNCVEVGTWRVSSHSVSGECLLVGAATAAVPPGRSAAGGDSAARWRKSTHSNVGGNCVEAAAIAATVAVRDTKDNGHGPVLRFAPRAWETFTTSLR